MANEENTSSEEELSLEEQLDEVPDEVVKEGEELAEKGQELNEEGQKAVDSAKSTKKVINKLPGPINSQRTENLLGSWSLYSASLSKANEQAGWITLSSVVSSAPSTLIYTSDAFEDFVAGIELNVGSELEDAVFGFREIVNRSADKDEALRLMRSLGLDKPREVGELSATELLKSAHSSFAQPAGGPTVAATTTLIPMRESIETTLNFLADLIPGGLPYAKIQGPNRPWKKAYGIASRFKLDEISEQQAEDWAQQWENLKNTDLSEAKTGDIDREECLGILSRATLFLISFLNGMNPNKIVKE